jgi:4-hydroxy-4-methyl-2-oxoglutarate aldolase
MYLAGAGLDDLARHHETSWGAPGRVLLKFTPPLKHSLHWMYDMPTNQGNSLRAEFLQKLARYDTPTICNAIEMFEVRPRAEGFMDSRIRAAFPDFSPMVGFAATAIVRSSAPSMGGDVYGSLDRQLVEMKNISGPAVIVLQDLDDPSVAATVGEVMCGVYQAFGAVGLITSGASRDLAQVRELAFPVFTQSIICAHGYAQTLDVGCPVRVGGLVVRPGDLMHGDANGVTNIPMEIASEVADVAAEYMAAERIVVDYVQAGGTKSVADMVERRRAMGEAIAALRQSVSRSKH